MTWHDGKLYVVAKRFVKDRRGLAGPDALGELAVGEGEVIKVDGEQVAVYRETEDEFHAVSAVCTHLSCIVHWNSAERSWDCPCHGSRFSTDGAVLHGPAVDPLEQQSLTVEQGASR